MNFAIVIPAYNETLTIVDVVTRALQQTQKVIVVDDGSTDDTLRKLDGLGAQVIPHSQNMGKAQSLWDGMQAALSLGVDAVITLDGDGQHCPEDIPRFLESAKANPQNIIIGARLADKSEIPAKRYYANKVANFWIAWAAGYPITDSQSGFRLYPSALLRQLIISTARDKSFVFESEVIIKAAQLGFKSNALKIAAIYNENARPSHFRSVMDIVLITRMVAWSLFTRGMYLPGLYRSTIKPKLFPKPFTAIGWDGVLTLFLSTIIIGVTAGVSYILTLLYAISFAKKSTITAQGSHHLLVLGMQLQNNEPNEYYKSRLDRAAACMHEDPSLVTILLGGITANANISEAQAGKQYLLNAGINESNIRIEDNSRHTLENLKQARDLLQLEDGKVTIISNRFHLARVHSLANGFKITHRLCAAEEYLPINEVTLLRLLIEAFEIHWYYAGKAFAHLTRNKYMLNRIT